MTLSQLITASGAKITQKDKSKIGWAIRRKAGELKVKFTKVDEIISVNNYPESFIKEMETIVINYLNEVK